MSAQETIDLRALPSDELDHELDESLRALFNLRFQAATRQLADVSQVRSARRRVARVRTLLRERDILTAIAEAVDEDALAADEPADDDVTADETTDEAAGDDAAADETTDEAADDDAAADETTDEAADDDAATEETTDEAADDDAAADETTDEAADDDAATEETTDEAADDDAADGERE